VVSRNSAGDNALKFDNLSNCDYWELMPNLIGMVILAVFALVLWLFRKQTWASAHPIAFKVALILAYSWTLLLALRFGARTYPGLFVPKSETLNNIFNSGQIFGTAYDLVVVAAPTDGLSFFLARRSRPTSQIAVRAALITRNLCLLLATLGAFYGFYFAIILERLPWQPD